MTNTEQVGTFSFGTGSISADQTGAFTLLTFNGTQWVFDVGEISSLDKILSQIGDKAASPTEEKPITFWRTTGMKVFEIYLAPAYFRRYDAIDSFSVRHGLIKPPWESSVIIREGGNTIGCVPVREIPTLRRHIRTLTEGAPYPRAVRLVDVVDEQRVERLVRVEHFPLNNRSSKTPLRVEKEFRQEIIKTLNVEATFGVGLDYYIKANLETKFGLSKEERISESVKVTMEAQPDECKEYVVSWKEVIAIGYAIFEVNGTREKVPFNLKSGLIPDVRQETLTPDKDGYLKP